METDPLLKDDVAEKRCLFYDSDETKYLKKINRQLFWGLLSFSIGFLLIITLMIVGLVRASSTLSEINKVNLTAIEETANSLNQIMANNGTEKIMLFLDSIDPNTITLYMLKMKNIIDEACHYFFRC